MIPSEVITHSQPTTSFETLTRSRLGDDAVVVTKSNRHNELLKQALDSNGAIAPMCNCTIFWSAFFEPKNHNAAFKLPEAGQHGAETLASTVFSLLGLGRVLFTVGCRHRARRDCFEGIARIVIKFVFCREQTSSVYTGCPIVSVPWESVSLSERLGAGSHMVLRVVKEVGNTEHEGRGRPVKDDDVRLVVERDWPVARPARTRDRGAHKCWLTRSVYHEFDILGLR